MPSLQAHLVPLKKLLGALPDRSSIAWGEGAVRPPAPKCPTLLCAEPSYPISANRLSLELIGQRMAIPVAWIPLSGLSQPLHPALRVLAFTIALACHWRKPAQAARMWLDHDAPGCSCLDGCQRLRPAIRPFFQLTSAAVPLPLQALINHRSGEGGAQRCLHKTSAAPVP
jgi:hypothetical protein